MIVYIALFLILFSSVAMSLNIFHNALPTILIRTLGYIILLYKFHNEFLLLLTKNKIIRYFSLLTMILIIWGLTISKTIEEYAVCIERFIIILFPIWIILMCQSQNKKYLRFIIWCVFLLGFSKYFGKYSQAMNNYSGYTSILYFYILFIPYLKLKYKIFLISFWILSYSYDMSDRTHMIMMIGCMVCAFSQFLNLNNISSKKLSLINKSIIILPIIFVLLSHQGIFNIFAYSESSTFDGMQGEQTNIDTRSGLYNEVIDEQGGIVSWIIGKSYVGSYNSGLAEVYGYTKFMRMGCEVGILEILIRGGLIYVIVIMLLYYYSSRNLLCHSNNRLCKSLGFFILLYWFCFFIELQMDSGMWNIALWFAFGISMNSSICKMSDNEVRKYFSDMISLKLI